MRGECACRSGGCAPARSISRGATPGTPGQGYGWGVARAARPGWMKLDRRAVVGSKGLIGRPALERKALPSGCHRREAQDHPGLPGVQAPQLHHQEEPAQRPGPARADEVLPELPLPPAAPRDPLTAVAVNTDYIGRTFPASEPYEVSRVKIAEIAVE